MNLETRWLALTDTRVSRSLHQKSPLLTNLETHWLALTEIRLQRKRTPQQLKPAGTAPLRTWGIFRQSELHSYLYRCELL